MKNSFDLKLHYDSLKIPKATKIDQNITEQLNNLYDFYDNKLNDDIEIATYNEINKIKEDDFTTTDRIIMYTIGGFTAFYIVYYYIHN